MSSTLRSRMILSALGAALTTVAVAGCSNNQPASPPTVVTTAPAPAPAAAPASTDTTAATPGSPATKINTNAGPGGSQGADSPVADAVNKAIVTNKEMTGSRIEVVVDASGIATLTGTAQNAQQKALAEAAAHNAAGVTGVKNKIMIDATGGIKSASAPTVTKTKVIIVHDKAPMTSAPPVGTDATPAPTDSTGTGAPSGQTGTDTNSTPSGSTPGTTTGTSTTPSGSQ